MEKAANGGQMSTVEGSADVKESAFIIQATGGEQRVFELPCFGGVGAEGAPGTRPVGGSH